MNDRARLTVPDVLFVLFGLASLMALMPVLYGSLERRASAMGTEELLLLQLIPPLAILVLLAVVYAKASGGAA